MNFETLVSKGKPVLLDGATGSQLILRGLKAGECPELWNIEHPEDIIQIGELYYEAGSDAVYTNSFGGSFLKLKDFGLENRAFEINLAAAKNGIAAKSENKYLIGSIGPSGKMLEPFGDVSEKEMIDSFVVQAAPLAEGGIDCFVLETFTDLNEIECAIKAVKENSNLPFIASMTFDKTPAGFHTMMGVSIEDAVYRLTALEALAVGSNCGNGIERMIEIGKEFRQISKEIKILLKANAGEPKYHNGRTVYSEDAGYFKKYADEIFLIDPAFVGGCCGTTPEHIKVLREVIDNYGK